MEQDSLGQKIIGEKTEMEDFYDIEKTNGIFHWVRDRESDRCNICRTKKASTPDFF
ncbi:MAG: hypothetical protein Q8R12_05185 [bacterium]|nr:hypothetical protein [bacterium]